MLRAMVVGAVQHIPRAAGGRHACIAPDRDPPDAAHVDALRRQAGHGLAIPCATAAGSLHALHIVAKPGCKGAAVGPVDQQVRTPAA